jgi:nucleotide-binding universal stress UspA family protein
VNSYEILVALDGSPVALVGAAVAIRLAQGLGLSVRGLYVVNASFALDTYADHRRELGTDREPRSRAELLAWFKDQGNGALGSLVLSCREAGVPLTTDLVVGGIARMVLRAANGARLVAVGRRGHGHQDDPDHLGRSFHAIARHIDRPLIVGGLEERTVQRVVVAYDGSRRAQPGLAWAGWLGGRLSAEVAVVAVQENGHQPTDGWLTEARARLPGCECLRREGQAAAEIVAAAAEWEADLIIMGRYRHIALVERLVGSTVDGVLRGSELPVLIARGDGPGA